MRLSPDDHVQADAVNLCCHVFPEDSKVWWGPDQSTGPWTQCVHAAAWNVEQLALPLAHAVLHPGGVCSRPVQATTWKGCLGLG